jgi:hypothetical protein
MRADAEVAPCESPQWAQSVLLDYIIQNKVQISLRATNVS